MNNNYRPTMQDYTDTGRFQSLSLSAAGDFDKKFHLKSKDGKVTARRATTGWRLVCLDRAAKGISRKARIRAKKEAQ